MVCLRTPSDARWEIRGRDVLRQANRTESNIDVFSKDVVDRARFGRNT